MFRSKTLFVVGAGASKEVNIPIGTELAEEIANLLYFEFDHFSKLQKGFPISRPTWIARSG